MLSNNFVLHLVVFYRVSSFGHYALLWSGILWVFNPHKLSILSSQQIRKAVLTTWSDKKVSHTHWIFSGTFLFCLFYYVIVPSTKKKSTWKGDRIEKSKWKMARHLLTLSERNSCQKLSQLKLYEATLFQKLHWLLLFHRLKWNAQLIVSEK